MKKNPTTPQPHPPPPSHSHSHSLSSSHPHAPPLSSSTAPHEHRAYNGSSLMGQMDRDRDCTVLHLSPSVPPPSNSNPSPKHWWYMPSNAHTAGNQYPPLVSAPKFSKCKAQGPRAHLVLSAPQLSSQGSFALAGGSSAPANNNRSSSTTNTFHIIITHTISTSLAATSSHVAPEAPKADADAEGEIMHITSFKCGSKTQHQCVYCQKDFSRKDDAYRHMSRKHNNNAMEFICVLF
ncbi:hypothetical protein DXG01_009871 [Tephrocybe rancida]|nr:hypothetical protein DXG01_009871 [Tephrocybe rancida]